MIFCYLDIWGFWYYGTYYNSVCVKKYGDSEKM